MIRTDREGTGAEINIEDDGTVPIAVNLADRKRQALAIIESCGKIPEVGKLYPGKVTSTRDSVAFGCLPGKEGLRDISHLAQNASLRSNRGDSSMRRSA